jgi:hypothetical protein
MESACSRSWIVILFEVAFPLALVVPRSAVYAFLVAGALMPLGIAFATRLNVFV